MNAPAFIPGLPYCVENMHQARSVRAIIGQEYTDIFAPKTGFTPSNTRCIAPLPRELLKYVPPNGTVCISGAGAGGEASDVHYLRPDCQLQTISLSAIDSYTPFSNQLYTLTNTIHHYASAMNKVLMGKYFEMAAWNFAYIQRNGIARGLFAQVTTPYIQTQHLVKDVADATIELGTVDLWVDRGGYSVYAADIVATRAHIVHCLSSQGVACFAARKNDVLHPSEVPMQSGDLYFFVPDSAYFVRAQAPCAERILSIIGKEIRQAIGPICKVGKPSTIKRLLEALQS